MKQLLAFLFALVAVVTISSAARASTDYEFDIGVTNGQSSGETKFVVYEGGTKSNGGSICEGYLYVVAGQYDEDLCSLDIDVDVGCTTTCGSITQGLWWHTTSDEFASAELHVPAYGDPYLSDESNSTDGATPSIDVDSKDDEVYYVTTTYE